MITYCQPSTVFGSKGDIQPQSLAVVRDHCKIRYDEGEGKVYVVGGKGDTWRNGKPVREGTEVCLDIYDRVAMGDQVPCQHIHHNNDVSIQYIICHTKMIHLLNSYLLLMHPLTHRSDLSITP